MIEVRLGPDGWIAQLMPAEAISPQAQAEGRRWLQMSWPDGNLVRADLLTDSEVADWRVIYHDESARTDPRRPQGKDGTTPLSHNLRPDEGSHP